MGCREEEDAWRRIRLRRAHFFYSAPPATLPSVLGLSKVSGSNTSDTGLPAASLFFPKEETAGKPECKTFNSLLLSVVRLSCFDQWGCRILPCLEACCADGASWALVPM